MSKLRLVAWSCALLTTTGVALAGAPPVPSADPMTEGEIVALIGGRTFDFVAYDEPLTGTTTWDLVDGSVSGSFVWDGSTKGKFNNKAYVRDGKLCTEQKNDKVVCQTVYRFEEGFMEVTGKGVVHAVSKPAK